MAVPQRVLTWLHNVLTSHYQNVNQTYSDVVQILQTYPSFSLKTDVYTFEDGSSSLLLNIHGALPVAFRGQTYGFPLSLWIPAAYPKHAPIIFMVPSGNMTVRPGQHVSGEGRVYHPYLAGWHGGRTNIVQLLSILQDVFAREPPLVAKQQQQNQPLSPTTQHRAIAPPIPPLPPERGRHDYGPPSAGGIRSENAAPPPPPPKTTVGEDNISSKYDRPAPLPPGAGGTNSYRDPQKPPQPNGHPHHPQSNPLDLSQVGAQFGRSTQGPYQTAHREFSPPHELTSPQYPRAPGPPTQYRSFQSPTPFYPPQQQHTKTYGPPDQLQHQQYHRPPDPRSMNQSPQQYQKPPYQSYGTQQPPPSTTRPAPRPAPSIDLLTSPFDTPLPTTSTVTTTPPPIPPNPQKDALLSTLSQTLTSQIRSTHQTTHSAIPPLLAQQRALTATLSSINAEIAQLESLDSLLTSNERILHKAMHDADRVLEDAKQRKVPDVDDVLVAPTVVAGQLYGAVAEQRAIEDCRAVLGKALDRGRVGAGVWARQTRSLAREEFLKKALVKKIGRGMGLVEEGAWS